LGALVGSVSRPVGGWLSDRIGGSKVTLWNFVLMGVAAAFVVVGERSGSFGLFFGAFLVLFVTAGVGNGSTYRMIPAIFVAQAQRETAAGADASEAVRKGKREAAAAIGIVSAIGAFGGFFVTRIIASSVSATKVADNAFYGFILFYVLCFAVTWWFYQRRSFAVAKLPSLALAKV
jgi:NNP family nitrate/nitrite transporter-like MFS transporter